MVSCPWSSWRSEWLLEARMFYVPRSLRRFALQVNCQQMVVAVVEGLHSQMVQDQVHLYCCSVIGSTALS